MAYDIDYSLNITLIVYMASSNKWILNTEATYYLCSFRELLVDFDIESDIVVMKSDQPCCRNEDKNSSSQDIRQNGKKIKRS